MKFVCTACEAFLKLERVERPGEGSVGLTFRCPSCGHAIAMVTNPGETQLVHSLGVNLGPGASSEPRPFALTERSLEGGANAEPGAASGVGKCPFANFLVTEEGAGAASRPAPAGPPNAPAAESVTWTPDAQARLDNVPEFVRPFARMTIEKMARERGAGVVDGALMDEARSRFM